MSSLPPDELQFQTVEPAVASAAPQSQVQTCVNCKRPIQSTYFAVRDLIVCPDCAARIRSGPPGNEGAKLVRAFVFGLGPAFAGGLVWGAILFYMHYQIGLIAVALGYMIGKAVKKGSGGRGGPVYQVMAVALAYSSIAFAHFLEFYALLSHNFQDVLTPFALVRIIQLAVKYPIASGAENPIGLLILGFALWEAWKFTKFYPVPLTGPYQVATKVVPISLAPLPEAGEIL